MQNQNKMIFDGVGKYGIPKILGTNINLDEYEWISFNYAKTCQEPHDKVVHFYLDDYQFERLWAHPEKYIDLLSRFKAITSPDFSLYADYPKALQIYNHFRKHWIGAYYQMHGITVIPTIGWSDKESFHWCFDGEPEHTTITVSDTGCLNNKEAKMAFYNGFSTAINVLQPRKIYLHTSNPNLERFETNDYNNFDTSKIKIINAKGIQRLREKGNRFFYKRNS